MKSELPNHSFPLEGLSPRRIRYPLSSSYLCF
uniref:Uncharacterized protein n=1 Tax=Myoviridae sp. ct6F13 TaxID=2827602 RepID=A0A8S5LIX6_9CAUD|nr:MAG TPA: hypothetical protein [Myoviridae sp. ct6F13]